VPDVRCDRPHASDRPPHAPRSTAVPFPLPRGCPWVKWRWVSAISRSFEPYFARAFRYAKNQFDCELYPDAIFLDTNPESSLVGSADLMTCSEVLETYPHPCNSCSMGHTRRCGRAER
jgi:hypothetical protein